MLLMRSVIRFIILGGLALSLLGTLLVIVMFWYYGRDLPGLERLEHYDPPQVSRVYGLDGRVLGEFGAERRSVVPVDEIPKLLLDAMVATEDATFYQHEGFDFFGIARAIIMNVLSLEVRQGASTITQQVMKNLLLTHERKVSRKVREAILAYRIEKSLGKRQILHLYANAIYFGNGCYGVAEAARFYFGKSLKELTVGEMAYLAGLPQSPGKYALNRHPERAKLRQRIVLRRLFELEYIDEPTYRRFDEAPLAHASPGDRAVEAPYVVDEVRRRLGAMLDGEVLTRGGLKVYTTIDPAMQAGMERALRSNLFDYDRRHGYRPLPVVSEEEKRKWIERVESLTRRMARLEGPAPLTAFSAEYPPRPVEEPGGGGGDDGDGDGERPEGEAQPAASPLWHTTIRRVQPGRLYYAFVLGVDSTSGDIRVQTGARAGLVRARDAAWALGKRKGRKLPGQLVKAFRPDQIVVVALADGGSGRDLDPVPLCMSQLPEAQSAMVAVDPEDRGIRAMAGGFSYFLSPFNRSTQAFRQPGSSFKPFVYLAAIRSRRFTPATRIVDEELRFKRPGGKPWSPGNFDGEFRGPVPLREALSKSINIIAVKLLKDVGVSPVVKLAKSLGIRSELQPNLTLALGSSDVSPLEMVNAFATFPAGGTYDDAQLIEKVVSAAGTVLHRRVPDPRPALSPEEAAMIVSLMRSVVEEGTGRRARALGRPLAGKTGTTNDHRDAWFVGYAPQLACGVWVGYDDHRMLGRGETGARAALPAWVSFMKAALDKRPVLPFPVAPDLVYLWIDPETGLRVEGDDPRARREVFLPGTEPAESP